MLIYIGPRRRALGMTQEELAARMGVSRPAIALWEAGTRKPGADKLPLLAEALVCGVGELFRAPEQDSREEAG